MARLQKKAENAVEIVFLEEMLRLLEEMEQQNGEEKKIYHSQIMEMLDAKCEEFEKKIEKLKAGPNGKVWDFSKERAMDIFAEDDVILLRNCKDSEKEKYIQVKKENTDDPEFYDNESAADSTWKMFKEEKSFCCTIIRKSDDEFIGYISIKDTKSNLWEIAIELLQEHCHKGYGSRAIALFLPAISKITNKAQFQALVETDNIPSQLLMEKLGARLIDIYDYTFQGDEEAATAFEEKYMYEITERMVILAEQIGVEPRKMLSHVLDYRFFVEDGKILNRARENS